MISITETIIRASFHLSVWIIEQFHDMRAYEDKVNEWRELGKGTLGKDVADCLDKYNLRLVPGFESHDLKHMLLDYKMTPVDEIRMQAFMLGNGNISIPSIAIFLYGFMLLPHKWNQFFKDFKLGLCSCSIKTWSMEQFADRQTMDLRKVVLNTKQEIDIMKQLSTIGSYSAIIAGLFGMLYCLPYLFSPVLEDLVGAGFPFVAGAILFASGLISLSMQRNQNAAGHNSSYKTCDAL
jgi:hypothetical protein